jgi:hypothetical protein
MPIFKNITILSEISIFFKKKDSNNALFTIMEMLKGINISEKTLFGRENKCNSKYSLLLKKKLRSLKRRVILNLEIHILLGIEPAEKRQQFL